MDIYAMY